MLNVDLNNPMDVRNVGMKALKEVLGPVGTVKFIQQFDLGYGDYTEEKYEEPDISLDEIAARSTTSSYPAGALQNDFISQEVQKQPPEVKRY